MFGDYCEKVKQTCEFFLNLCRKDKNQLIKSFCVYFKQYFRIQSLITSFCKNNLTFSRYELFGNAIVNI